MRPWKRPERPQRFHALTLALFLATDTRKDHFKIVHKAKRRKQIEWLKKSRPDLHERVRRALERPGIGPRRSRNVRQRDC